MSAPISKRYTFAKIAKRECADCTTTITTTKINRYLTEEDFETYRSHVEGLLRQIRNDAVGLYETIEECYGGDDIYHKILAAIDEELGRKQG